MILTGYGNASLKLELAGQTVFFDPFHKDFTPVDEPPAKTQARLEAFLSAGDIFLTHGHFDHLGSIPALYAGRDVRVYCTPTPARTLVKQGFPREMLRPVTPGETVALGQLRITAYHTSHCAFNAGEIKNILLHHHALRRMGQLLFLLRRHMACPAGDECLLYEAAGEGLRVQILGSAGLDAGTRYPTGADVLVLPYQGRSDMPRWCMGIVERLAPRRVLLDHFDDAFPPMTAPQDTGAFLREMARRLPHIPCQALGEGERFIL